MSQTTTTPTTRPDYATEYEDGTGIRDLAKKYGKAYGTMRRMLLDADVTLRPKGGSRIRPMPK